MALKNPELNGSGLLDRRMLEGVDPWQPEIDAEAP
jgi:hypothetical protein